MLTWLKPVARTALLAASLSQARARRVRLPCAISGGGRYRERPRPSPERRLSRAQGSIRVGVDRHREKRAMSAYLILWNWTEDGVKSFRESTRRRRGGQG